MISDLFPIHFSLLRKFIPILSHNNVWNLALFKLILKGLITWHFSHGFVRVHWWLSLWMLSFFLSPEKFNNTCDLICDPFWMLFMKFIEIKIVEFQIFFFIVCFCFWSFHNLSGASWGLHYLTWIRLFNLLELALVFHLFHWRRFRRFVSGVGELCVIRCWFFLFSTSIKVKRLKLHLSSNDFKVLFWSIFFKLSDNQIGNFGFIFAWILSWVDGESHFEVLFIALFRRRLW